MKSEMLSLTFEHALSRMPLEASCAYLAICKHLPTTHREQFPMQSIFFLAFFSQAKEICEHDAQGYFRSESLQENIQKAYLNWDLFVSKTIEPYLRQHSVYPRFNKTLLRLVASDTITFYEWVHDVGYLKADKVFRMQWMSESPLSE